jgi:hypothetical protein
MPYTMPDPSKSWLARLTLPILYGGNYQAYVDDQRQQEQMDILRENAKRAAEAQAQETQLRRAALIGQFMKLPSDARQMLGPSYAQILGVDPGVLQNLPPSEAEVRTQELQEGKGPAAALSPQDRARMIYGYPPEAPWHGFAPQKLTPFETAQQDYINSVTAIQAARQSGADPATIQRLQAEAARRKAILDQISAELSSSKGGFQMPQEGGAGTLGGGQTTGVPQGPTPLQKRVQEDQGTIQGQEGGASGSFEAPPYGGPPMPAQPDYTPQQAPGGPGLTPMLGGSSMAAPPRTSRRMAQAAPLPSPYQPTPNPAPQVGLTANPQILGFPSLPLPPWGAAPRFPTIGMPA